MLRVSFLVVLGALRTVWVVLEGPGNRLEFICISGSPWDSYGVPLVSKGPQLMAVGSPLGVNSRTIWAQSTPVARFKWIYVVLHRFIWIYVDLHLFRWFYVDLIGFMRFQTYCTQRLGVWA